MKAYAIVVKGGIITGAFFSIRLAVLVLTSDAV
jgi:hypothetical protein